MSHSFPSHIGNDLFQERRMLRFDTRAPAETAAGSFDAYETMRGNADVKRYLSAFSNVETLSKYPLLRNAPDREFFNALMLDSALPDTYDYRTVRAGDMQGADLLGLLARFGADDGQIGAHLRAHCADFVTNGLGGAAQTDAQLGQKYRALVTADQVNWKNGANVNQTYVDAAADKYLVSKADVAALLAGARITPALGATEAGAIAGKTLSRQEYLALLALRWKDGLSDASAAIAGKTGEEALVALRQYFLDTNIAEKYKKILTLHIDVSVGSAPYNEILNRYGVVLGPGLLAEYIQHGRGLLPKGATEAPNDRAASWDANPKFAYDFLNGRLPATEGNREFLRALRYHRMLTDAERDEEKKNPDNVPRMSREDVDTILSYIIATLQEREQVIADSMRQRTDWKQRESFAEGVERHAGQVFNYITNFQDHPVGSALWGLGAFLIGRKIWRGVFGDKKEGQQNDKKVSLVGWLGQTAAILTIGGFAVHLYRKDTAGKSLGDDLVAGLDWMKGKAGFGPEADPQRETFPEYWSKQLTADPELPTATVNDSQMQYAISEMQDKPIGEVLEWYRQMELRRVAGGGPLPWPFAIQKKSKMFGQLPSKDVANIFHQTLHRFFYNRGKSLPVGTRTVTAAGVGFAERGYAFIRDTYNQSRDVRVVGAEYRQAFVEYEYDNDGDPATPALVVDLTNPLSPNYITLATEQPDVLQSLLVGRMLFNDKRTTEHMAKMHMWQIFLIEADPNILRTSGPTGARLASLVEELQREVDDAAIAAARGGLVVPPVGPVGQVLANGDEIRVGRGTVLFDGVKIPTGAVLPEGVVLPVGAVLEPPLTLPRGAVLPENIVVPPGVLLPDGIVLPKGAVLGPGVVVPAGATLKDSVDARGAVLIAPNITVGPGTLLADNAVIGQGAVLHGGVTVPKGAVFQGPVTLRNGVVIVDDSGVRLPPGSRIDPAVEISKGAVLLKGLQLAPGTVIKAGALIEGGTGATLPPGTVKPGAGGVVFDKDHVVPAAGWKVD